MHILHNKLKLAHHAQNFLLSQAIRVNLKMLVMIRIALFQPEIPHNTGTLLRLAACWGLDVDIIHPCGFSFHDRHLRRSGMDYVDFQKVTHHDDYNAFVTNQKATLRRMILVTPKAPTQHISFAFSPNDTLMMGQESDGFPDDVLESIHDHVSIPMLPQKRSLNMAIAASIVTAEALRQLHLYPQSMERRHASSTS